MIKSETLIMVGKNVMPRPIKEYSMGIQWVLLKRELQRIPKSQDSAKTQSFLRKDFEVVPQDWGVLKGCNDVTTRRPCHSHRNDRVLLKVLVLILNVSCDVE